MGADMSDVKRPIVAFGLTAPSLLVIGTVVYGVLMAVPDWWSIPLAAAVAFILWAFARLIAGRGRA